MVIVLGHITLESAAECQRLLQVLAARAERCRAEAGNLDYAFARSVENACEIRLTEVWQSAASLTAHLQIPDAAFDAALATARIVRATVTAYDGQNPRVLMSRPAPA